MHSTNPAVLLAVSALPSSFHSERLLARLPVPGDAPLLFAAYTSKPVVSRYMMWRPHRDADETAAFVAGCIAAAEARTRLPYVLAERSSPDQPIGMLEARPVEHKVDLGYVLAPECWGRGYMPEAVRTLTAQALEVRGIFRVQAFCDVQNVPSQRTLEKAGFFREGRHERFIVHPNLSSEPRACFMYANCR